MGHTNKNQSTRIHYQNDPSLKKLKQRRSRSIRSNNNSNDIEDFNNKSRSFKYQKSNKKTKQENLLINNDRFEKQYIINELNCNNIINNNWKKEKLDNKSILNKTMNQIEDENLKNYIKTNLKQLKRRGKTGTFKGHKSDKCYETLLN